MSSEPGTNRPIWDAEKDYPEMCGALREGLIEIVDPELGYNILELGLVRNVTIREDSAIVRMILTTPFCPYGPSMLESTRKKAEEVLKIPTSMDFGMDPWDFSMMEEGLEPDWGLY